jgi:hypothetical protein
MIPHADSEEDLYYIVGLTDGFVTEQIKNSFET